LALVSVAFVLAADQFGMENSPSAPKPAAQALNQRSVFRHRSLKMSLRRQHLHRGEVSPDSLFSFDKHISMHP
jgi:hypothetical protein